MSLRLRLLLALVALVAVGLLVADGVTYVSLRSFLSPGRPAARVSARHPVTACARSAGAQPAGCRPEAAGVACPNSRPGTYGAVLEPVGVRRWARSPSPTAGRPPRRRPRRRAAAAVPSGVADRSSRRPPPATAPRLPRAGDAGAGQTATRSSWPSPCRRVPRRSGSCCSSRCWSRVRRPARLAAARLVDRAPRDAPLEDMAATAGAIAAGDLARASSAPSRAPRWAAWASP